MTPLPAAAIDDEAAEAAFDAAFAAAFGEGEPPPPPLDDYDAPAAPPAPLPPPPAIPSRVTGAPKALPWVKQKQPQMLTFEVYLERATINGSLGLTIEPYQGHPTICNIIEGGPAHADGTLHLGDVIVAVEGKPTHNMEQVTEAIISCGTAGVRIAVVRPPLKKLKQSVVYFHVSSSGEGVQAGTDYDAFELTIMSNRQLIFEQLDKPFTYGQVHLQLGRSLQFVKASSYNLCLRLNLDEEECHMHHLEWYADTIQELREWERMLRSLMVSDEVAKRQMRSGWFVVFAMGSHSVDGAIKRWIQVEDLHLTSTSHILGLHPAYYILTYCSDRYYILHPTYHMLRTTWIQVEDGVVLACYDVEHNDNVEAATLTLNLKTAERVRLLDNQAAQVILRGGDRAGAEGGVTEILRKEVDVRVDNPGQPLGLEFFENGPGEEGLFVAGVEPASAAERYFENGLLRVNDRLVELDGNPVMDEDEYDDVLDHVEKSRKLAHTLLLERVQEAMVPVQERAIEVTTRHQRWLLYPCNASSDDRPMALQTAAAVVEDWHQYMSKVVEASRARRLSVQSGQTADLVLQAIQVELWDEARDWADYYLVLFKVKGLCFYDSVEDYEAHEAPDRVIPLEAIKHASHAFGPDYYDGVIDLETTLEPETRAGRKSRSSQAAPGGSPPRQSSDGALFRLRVGHLNAPMHKLLSALNIYKRGVVLKDAKEAAGAPSAAEQKKRMVAKRGSVVMREEFTQAKRAEMEKQVKEAEEMAKEMASLLEQQHGDEALQQQHGEVPLQLADATSEQPSVARQLFSKKKSEGSIGGRSSRSSKEQRASERSTSTSSGKPSGAKSPRSPRSPRSQSPRDTKPRASDSGAGVGVAASPRGSSTTPRKTGILGGKARLLPPKSPKPPAKN